MRRQWCRRRWGQGRFGSRVRVEGARVRVGGARVRVGGARVRVEGATALGPVGVRPQPIPSPPAHPPLSCDQSAVSTKQKMPERC